MNNCCSKLAVTSKMICRWIKKETKVQMWYVGCRKFSSKVFFSVQNLFDMYCIICQIAQYRIVFFVVVVFESVLYILLLVYARFRKWGSKVFVSQHLSCWCQFFPISFLQKSHFGASLMCQAYWLLFRYVRTFYII